MKQACAVIACGVLLAVLTGVVLVRAVRLPPWGGVELCLRGPVRLVYINPQSRSVLCAYGSDQKTKVFRWGER